MEAKGKGMIVKMDMGNSFDHVSNSFLFKVLDKFGFCVGFIQFVSSCISFPLITPLVKVDPLIFSKSIGD
jgi:hypothetical protein